jgi:hypothetical protein
MSPTMAAAGIGAAPRSQREQKRGGEEYSG